MALPLSFGNSFWSPEGFNLEPLLGKLHAGTVENHEILRFIADRANCSSEAAKALFDAAELNLSKKGFNKDEGASLRRTFEGLKYETGQTAKAHETVANNLDHMVVRPFTTWSHAHEGRVSDIRDRLSEAIKDWEELSAEVRRLKEQRNIKCTLAEEAEDDLRFAPTSPGATSASASVPRARSDSAASASATHAVNVARDTATQAAQAAQQASQAASNLARSFSQRMRVSPTANAVKQRFDRMRLEAREKELAAKGRDANAAILEEEELVDDEGSTLHGSEKGEVVNKEKLAGVLAPAAELTEAKDKKVKIDELEIGGIFKHPKDWSIIFARAKTQVPTTAVKVPLIGTTPDAHSGEDLVLWFRENLDDLGNSLSRSHEFCRQLSEELSILRLVGEIGNKFFDSSDAFYAWRPEAFHLENVQKENNDATSAIAGSGGDNVKEGEDHLTELPQPIREKRSSNTPLTSPRMRPQSPPSVPEKDGDTPMSPSAMFSTSPGTGGSSGLSRSNTLSSYLSSAYEKAASNVSSLNARMGKIGSGSERLDKLKKEAEEAEESYRVVIRELEDSRLQVEELFAASLSRAQKLEADRLKAIKSVITTFNATIASLNTPLQLSSERSALLGEAFIPSHDINSIIERYRTGPFRPKPNVWTDFYHEQTDVRFGVDLRHWRDTHDAKEEKMPDLLEQLFSVLKDGYAGRKDDDERRKTWIYEVPLSYTHRFRNSLNSVASPLRTEEIQRFDLPVVASGLKLYLLELAVSLVPSTLYADVKAIYPSVGADKVDQAARTASILSLLERVPKIHLVVLDALLVHLNTLISNTKTEESDSEYITKLGHVLGPCVVRPAVDSSKTLNDRFPAQFFSDLLRNYDALLPPTLEKKNKVEEERYAPKRQRTKMVDQRMTRSNNTNGTGQPSGVPAPTERSKDWLKQELEKRTGQKIVEEPGSMMDDKTVASKDAELPKVPEEERQAQRIPSPAPSDDLGKQQQAQEMVQPGNEEADAREEDTDGAEEKLEIPLPPASTGDISPGFVTPSEEVTTQPLAAAAGRGEEPEVAPPSAATTEKDSGEDEEDLDKPLVANVALHRSVTGSSARRAPPPARTGSPSLGSSTKTRGPRPMSMQNPSPSTAASSAAMSPSTSAGSSAAAGVRARAAMFEGRGGDTQSTPPARGHRTNASIDTAGLNR